MSELHATLLTTIIAGTLAATASCSTESFKKTEQPGSDTDPTTTVGDPVPQGDREYADGQRPGDGTRPGDSITAGDTHFPGDPTLPGDTSPSGDTSPPGDAAIQDDTLNTGDTSGQQAAAGKPGAPCSQDSQCDNWPGTGNDDEQWAVCLTVADGFPGGYCSFYCSLPEWGNYGCNGYGGEYVAYSSAWGDGLCYHGCDAPNDCRVGYRCVRGACMPDCNDTDKPCDFGECDSVVDHVCEAP